MAAVAVVMAFSISPAPAQSGSRAENLQQRIDQARDQDRVFTLGRDGWIIERFGRNIAILRTALTTSGASSPPAGLLVLSCEGGMLRWRLRFNMPIVEDGDTFRFAYVLLRPSGQPVSVDLSRVGHAEILDRRVLTIAESGRSTIGFNSAFVRLLKAGTDRIDLLIRSGSVVLSQSLFVPVVPTYVLMPVVRRTDLIAFDDFLSTCTATFR